MATISIRGKEKIIAHFKNALNPYWKLYNASDPKSPIQSCLDVKDVAQSLPYLNDILDSLDMNGTYILDTYSKTENGEKQRFLKPDTSMCFALSDSVVSGLEVKEKKDFQSSQPASLKEHIAVIQENAKLSVEVNYYKEKWEEAKKEIIELNYLIDELEDELEELEEEEEEEQSVSGTDVPKTADQAIAKLISDHGGTIIENFMSKGVKGSVKFDTQEEEEPEEEQGEFKVNGMEEMPSIEIIIEKLKQKDWQLQKHLYKLLLIAEQKPSTFKTFLNKLESF